MTAVEYRTQALAILKKIAKVLWGEIGKHHTNETVYAFLFDIYDQFPSANPVAVTEESLTRLAQEYLDRAMASGPRIWTHWQVCGHSFAGMPLAMTWQDGMVLRFIVRSRTRCQ